MNWRVKWYLIPAVVVLVLFVLPEEVRPIHVVAFFVLAALGTWWKFYGSKKFSEYRDPSPVRTENKDMYRQEGPWTSKRTYRYPPNLDGHPRAEFSPEEQAFITNFWFKDRFLESCQRAGLVRIVPSDDPDTPDRKKIPGIQGFVVEPTGIKVYIVSTTSGFKPSDIASAQEALCQTIPGDSDITAHTERQSAIFHLHSRAPLADTFNAASVFGAAPPSKKKSVTADDFLEAMEDDDV